MATNEQNLKRVKDAVAVAVDLLGANVVQNMIARHVGDVAVPHFEVAPTGSAFVHLGSLPRSTVAVQPGAALAYALALIMEAGKAINHNGKRFTADVLADKESE
jgi:hypothetical protein